MEIGGYQNSNVVNGKIIGTVPQYIKIEAKSEFYTVTDMNNTFIGCSNLTVAPEIPSSVTSMDYTFYGCTSLTGNLVINANPTGYGECLSDASTAAGTNLVVSGTSTLLDEIIATKSENSNITKGN